MPLHRQSNLHIRAALVLACALWPCARATVLPPTFEELADRAELVVVGEVASSRAEWRTVGTNAVIFTLIEFKTTEVLKGNAGPLVTLQFLGGTVGDVTLEVAEVPRLVPGSRVLLFLEGNGVQFCPIVGLFHGRFDLRKDVATGRETVYMHDGKPLRDVREIGLVERAELNQSRAPLSIPAAGGPLSLEDFKGLLRSHLGRKRSR